MNRTAPRIFLAAAAIVASVATAGAQAPDPHHPGAPAAAAPMAMPPASVPVPGAGDQAGGPMGGEMGRMMETMRPSTAGGMGMPFEHVEGRIAYMKAELKVTDAQLVPWNAFADTMRADASAMKAMHDGQGGRADRDARPHGGAAQDDDRTHGDDGAVRNEHEGALRRAVGRAADDLRPADVRPDGDDVIMEHGDGCDPGSPPPPPWWETVSGLVQYAARVPGWFSRPFSPGVRSGTA